MNQTKSRIRQWVRLTMSSLGELRTALHIQHRLPFIGAAGKANTMCNVILTTAFTFDKVFQRQRIVRAAAMGTAM